MKKRIVGVVAILAFILFSFTGCQFYKGTPGKNNSKVELNSEAVRIPSSGQEAGGVSGAISR